MWAAFINACWGLAGRHCGQDRACLVDTWDGYRSWEARVPQQLLVVVSCGGAADRQIPWHGDLGTDWTPVASHTGWQKGVAASALELVLISEG